MVYPITVIQYNVIVIVLVIVIIVPSSVFLYFVPLGLIVDIQ